MKEAGSLSLCPKCTEGNAYGEGPMPFDERLQAQLGIPFFFGDGKRKHVSEKSKASNARY